jgi:hypothetical protein
VGPSIEVFDQFCMHLHPLMRLKSRPLLDKTIENVEEEVSVDLTLLERAFRICCVVPE